MRVRIRPYTPKDEAACLEVFRSNLGKFFAEGEEADFTAHLRGHHPYLVLEEGPQIVGCGGYALEPDGSASLCWGMVRRDRHGSGLGMRLLLERLNRIIQLPEVRAIRLDTSQHTCGFFEKLGFVTESVTPSGYGPGLDRYDMSLSLDEVARRRIQTAYQEVQP